MGLARLVIHTPITAVLLLEFRNLLLRDRRLFFVDLRLFLDLRNC